MGLDVYLQYKGNDIPEMNSQQFPEHYFKLNYFRSSYNDSGINRFCRTRYNNDGLYFIFNEDDKEKNSEIYKPDWKGALERAKELLHLIETDPISNVVVGFQDVDTDSEVDTAKAVKIFTEEFTKNFVTPDPFDKYNYSNRDGVFLFGSTETLIAMIPGKMRPYPGSGVFIFTQGKEKVTTWYEQAVKIIIESIELVLNSGDPENYSLIWSA